MVWEYIKEAFEYVKDFIIDTLEEIKDFVLNIFSDFGWGYFSDVLSWIITIPLWIGWSWMLWKIPMWRATYGDAPIIGLIVIMPFTFYAFARYKINK